MNMDSDKMIQQVTLCYRIILETTRDVFGDENMSEDVMCRAISEASATVWHIASLECRNSDE